jgi:alkylhydroperoxidase family enzyme
VTTDREGRVPRLPLDEAKSAADEAGVPDYMAELAIFQVLLNHPKLASGLNDLLARMLWQGKLDSRLRELAIMRIGWLTACEYEWSQHWRVAQGLGVRPGRAGRTCRHRRRGPGRRGGCAELGGVPAGVRPRPGDAG